MSRESRRGLNPIVGFGLLALALIVFGVPVAGWVIDEVDDSGGARDIGLRIVSPAQGATVTSPFVLEVESENVTIADPSEGEAGAYHYHAFVDIHPFTPGGQVIPEGDGIYHFWEETLELDLPPGEHQIVVVLGDDDEVRPTDAPAHEVAIVVVE